MPTPSGQVASLRLYDSRVAAYRTHHLTVANPYTAHHVAAAEESLGCSGNFCAISRLVLVLNLGRHTRHQDDATIEGGCGGSR